MAPLTMTGMSGSVSTLSASSGGASGAPEFNWRYYAYGQSIAYGRTVVIWRQTNGTVNTLRTVIGQQHTGFTQTWNSYTEDLSSYSGTTGRIYIGYETGNSFYNDPQYDNMELVDTTSGTISRSRNINWKS